MVGVATLLLSFLIALPFSATVTAQAAAGLTPIRYDMCMQIADAERCPQQVLAESIPPASPAQLQEDGSAISGTVLATDGTVITGTAMTVHFHNVTSGMNWWTWISAEDGFYSIAGLTAGAYMVEANSSARPDYVTKYYNDKLTWDEADLIELSAAQSVTDIDFSLERAGAISGRVYREADNEPVIGACVNLSMTAPEWSNFRGWCCTDDGGNFTIDALPADRFYYLRTHADCGNQHPDLIDEWYATSGSTADGNAADLVSVVPGETVSGIDFSLDVPSIIGLHYHFAIDDPATGKANVAIEVVNLNSEYFEVEEHGYHGIAANIASLTAYDMDGNALGVEHLPDAGTIYQDQPADVWRISAAGHSNIRIEYVWASGSMHNNEYRGYIAPNFAALAGEYAFLAPRNAESENIAVSFSLPPDWDVYVPWTQDGDSYDPSLAEGHALRNLMLSTIGLGRFDVAVKRIGETDVAVATYDEWGDNMADYLREGAWSHFSYQTDLFGDGVGERYLALFVPVADDNRHIYLGEWSNSQGYSIRIEENDSYWGRWGMFSHQIFHRWNAWEPWGMNLYDTWFREGCDVFYEMKSATVLRSNRPHEDLDERLQGTYEEYLKEYVEKGTDQALTSTDLDSFMIYSKGSLASFLLAKEIYMRTDGMQTIDSLLQQMYEKYGHHQGSCSDDCIQQEVEALTGSDFSQFFDDYIHGVETLPLEWAFEDADGDGLLNGIELGWNSHPNRVDTDSDGYSDAQEVALHTDPADSASVPKRISLPAILAQW